MSRQMSQLQGAKMQAATFPNDVRLQMVAGNLSRESGDHEGACNYYFAAVGLGLPIDGRFEIYFEEPPPEVLQTVAVTMTVGLVLIAPAYAWLLRVFGPGATPRA